MNSCPRCSEPLSPKFRILYRWVKGRRSPLTAQVKTHSSADPPVYARDMLRDHRSSLFLVPDDHVSGLRDHWRGQVQDLNARGLPAVEAQRHLSRVGGLGFTVRELDDHLQKATKYALRERGATYISVGASMAMALGPDLWTWIRTGQGSEITGLRVTQGASFVATERAMTWSLGRVGDGALRGGLRGNLVTGLAMLVVGTSWSIYENGGAAAFKRPAFYTHLGGTIGGLALALAVGTPVSVYVTLWTAPVVGGWAPFLGGAAGLVAGFGASIAGGIGGEYVAQRLVRLADPEWNIDNERKEFALVRETISDDIRRLQQRPN